MKMGKRSAVKNLRPIALPSEGSIAYAYQLRCRDDAGTVDHLEITTSLSQELSRHVVPTLLSEDDDMNYQREADEAPLVRRATDLIRRAFSPASAVSQSVSSSQPVLLLVLQLLNHLHTAETITQQLKRLQSFKSHLSKRQQSSSVAPSSSPDTPRSDVTRNDDQQVLQALVYILMEWCISPSTPMALRRSIQSTLGVLGTAFSIPTHQSVTTSNHEVSTDQDHLDVMLWDVYQHILKSFVMDPANGVTYWTKPLLSCKEFLNLLQQTPSSECQAFWERSTSPKDSEPVSNRRVAFAFLYRQAQQSIGQLPLIRFHDTLGEGSNKVDNTPPLGLMTVLSPPVVEAVEKSVQMAGLVHTVFVLSPSNDPVEESLERVKADWRQWQDFASLLWSLLTCPVMLSEHYFTIGLAISVAEMERLQIEAVLADKEAGKPAEHTLEEDLHSVSCNGGGTSDSKYMQEGLHELLHRVERQELPDLISSAFYRGLAVTLEDHLLFSSQATSLSTKTETDPANAEGETVVVYSKILNSFQKMALTSTSPDVRLVAIKGIQTIVRRYSSYMDATLDPASPGHSDLEKGRNLKRTAFIVNGSLQVVLQAWENPPTKSLAAAVPVLFRVLVSLVKKGMDLPSSDPDVHSIDSILERVLQQPPNCKGRYLALETLLPETSAKRIMTSQTVLDDLISGIGDSGHNTVVIADLWAKLLRALLKELAEDVGVSALPEAGRLPNRKERRKLKASSSKSVNANSPDAPLERNDASEQNNHTILLENWCGICLASLIRGLTDTDQARRKRVADFCLPRLITALGGNSASEVVSVFSILLSKLDEQEANPGDMPEARETGKDRISCAQCEIAVAAAKSGFIHGTVGLNMRTTISAYLTKAKMMSLLLHNSTDVRVVAFKAIEVYSLSNSVTADPTEGEMEMWKSALPYATKVSAKEYCSTVIGALLSFLDRLLSWEATHADRHHAGLKCCPTLSKSYSFIVDFLLKKLIIRNTAYIGTAADKEGFALSLLESVLVFSSRDSSLISYGRVSPRSGGWYQRKRRQSEEKTMSLVRVALLSSACTGVLIGLIGSIWEQTRIGAYCLLKGILRMGRLYALPVSDPFSTPDSRRNHERRALFLASSPRQREADTGSRLLAALVLSSSCQTEREQLMYRLVGVLERRIHTMKARLELILKDSSDLSMGKELPLGHGVIHTLRLVIEDGETKSSEIDIDRLIRILCSALELSLSVVADVRDTQPLESESVADGSKSQLGIKVNPGAIGANGLFSSVTRSSDIEMIRRLASQRIVVGTWLLTKEASTALSVIVSMKGSPLDSRALGEIGELLLTTMTSLKHSGAAFCAHAAIQRLAIVCFECEDVSNQNLPSEWLGRLMAELIDVERVRNSTLRRSTGYSLGFLALLRSEVASRSEPRPLCRYALVNLLRLSLPPDQQLTRFTEKIGYNHADFRSLFSFLQYETSSRHANHYESRSRIHALNILRAILLDSPLSREVVPFAGDAIASSLVGYLDSDWGVRNAATMVFAAAMLRIVDADKNASKTDRTSSKAIPITELFQSYPSLSPFLQSLLRGAVKNTFEDKRSQALPPQLPIVLLLSRVQPVANSGMEAVSAAEPFVPLLIQSLGHFHISVRKAAARALTNLAAEGFGFTFSLEKLLKQLSETVEDRRAPWNLVHGSLHAIARLLDAFPATKCDAHSYLSECLKRTILNPQRRVPPVCRAEGLEIMAQLRHRSIGIPVEACENAIPSLKDAKTQAMSPELAISSVRCVLQDTLSDLFHRDSCEGHLGKLTNLLRSPCIDIRLFAVKDFKKSIYGGLDSVLSRSKEDPKGCQRFVEVLALSLTETLAYEKDRGIDGKIDTPTLRRLSRCVLECLRALDLMSCSELTATLTKELLKISRPLLQTAHSLNVENTTQLTGNWTELVAYSLRGTECTSDDSNCFSKIVSILADDNVQSWRLRLSAASAIHSSGILFDSNPQYPAQNHLWRTTFYLLQDQDEDVRHAASRAIAGRRQVHDSIRVPDIVLREASQSCFVALGVASFYECSLDMVLSFCTRLEEHVSARAEEMERELSLVQGTGAKFDASNIESRRKIFEEEAQNSYVELSLLAQTLLATLVNKSSLFSEDILVTAAALQTTQSFEACSKTLTVLVEWRRSRARAKDGRVASISDIVCYPKIFPQFHSLLLAVTCMLHFKKRAKGRERDLLQKFLSNILNSAKELLTEELSDDIGPLALIHQVLKAMVMMDTGSDNEELSQGKSQQAILECCFLLC